MDHVQSLSDLGPLPVEESEYFGESTPQFHTGDTDLFGDRTIGYGGIGTVDEENDMVHYCINLRSGEHAKMAAVTFSVLTSLAQSFHSDVVSHDIHRAQMAFLFTSTANELHGHSVSGFLYHPFVQWLIYRASKKGVPHPRKVLLAMKDAWRAVARSENARRFVKHCSVRIEPDGRFSLRCLGDACDLSIYPEEICGEIIGEEIIRFSSHNLDRVDQQLTLLAGFAAMWDLAREEWNKNQKILR
jgi:hypothetical protein